MPELEGGHAGRESRVTRIVLPAYNEEASLGDLLDMIAETMVAHHLPYHVTVVDDGSTDRTGEIARDASTRMLLQLLRNEPNQGLGFTIRRGLRAAAEAAGPDDRIVTLDADLTQDPKYIPAMLAALDESPADVVIASRYRRGSGIEGLPTYRRLLSYGASFAVALLRPIRGVRDYSCGFRAYRASAVQWGFRTYGDRFVSERGFACMLEIAERLRGQAIFVEVPFVLRYDEKRKESAIKIWPTIRAYLRVIRTLRAEAHAQTR